jgi:hypothetical protein
MEGCKWDVSLPKNPGFLRFKGLFGKQIHMLRLAFEGYFTKAGNTIAF